MVGLERGIFFFRIENSFATNPPTDFQMLKSHGENCGKPDKYDNRAICRRFSQTKKRLTLSVKRSNFVLKTHFTNQLLYQLSYTGIAPRYH